MVASLQHKKEALEAKIRDKTSELRKLCIEEAELTGVLPSETPLEPGESPPQFRRRVGTSFTYPESLINKLKSKEDEALAALELECKIQTGIAEAALGLANDGTASKSVRRKHRILYEESQRRLLELEARLNALRQAQPKQKKKPRPQTEIENDCIDGEADNISDYGRVSMLMPVPENGPEKCLFMKNSHTFGGFQKSEPNIHPYHQGHQRITQSNITLPNIDYRHSVMVPDFHHNVIRSTNPSPNEMNDGWWTKNREIIHATSLRHSPLMLTNAPDYYVDSFIATDRFGSLDRNSQPLQSFENENRISATLPRNVYTTQGNNSSVLLPSQTYPENSLMRTQSLGSVDNSKQHPERKTKEKEWYETSLDSSPAKVVPKVEAPSPLNEEKVLPYHYENSNSKMNQASINSIQFVTETIVPYESPKNHTVVQAGKWQPYREVTKPFEMSDFYKYSTKFRKGQNQNNSQANEPSPSQQQKGVYKPLRPLECHALAPNMYNDNTNQKMSPHANSSQNERYTNELISWYHDKGGTPKPRSSTLV